MKIFIVLTLLCFVLTASSHKILGIFPHIGGSHFDVFKPFLKKLAETGHEVTVISHFPQEKPLKNYKDISLKGTVPILKNAIPFDFVTFFEPLELIIRHFITALALIDYGKQTCKVLMENQEVQNLKKGQFDLILFEDFNTDCPLALVYKLQAPSIAMTANGMFPWTMEKFGLITNPSYVPSNNYGGGRHVTMMEAFCSFLINNFYSWSYYLMSQIPDSYSLKKYVGDDMPCLSKISKNVSMVFANTHFSLNGAYHVPPNVLEIGGIYHGEVKKLPEDIKNYLDNAKDGVILFSMGSMLDSSSMPIEKLKIFQEVFSNLPQKVIWKWESETMIDKPNNVKIVKWIPQFDILHHKNVKAFITHSGMLGTSETIKAGVPAVAIPMFGDQFYNAIALEESGGGIYLKYSNITKKSLKWALETVLNPKMAESANRLSKLWNDRPMSAMDSALYWADHVAKYGGSHLQPTSKELPLYRYLLLDVILMLLTITFLFISIIRRIYGGICSGLSKIFSSKKKQD